MAIDQDITNLPTPPSRSDSPSDFSDKADTFLAALPQLQTELNLYADEANTTQTAINTSETNAATSETNAESWASKTTGIVLNTDFSAKAYALGGTGVTDVVGAAKEWAIKTGSTVDGNDFSAKKYAIDAEASADAAASVVGATAWDSGVTYGKNDAAVGSDGKTYRSLVDGNLGNDPVAGDGTKWLSLTPTVTKAELTKTFTSGEEVVLSLEEDITTAPVVSVTKEVPQLNQTNNEWDVASDGTNYTLHDTAYSTTLTPSDAGADGTFTLGTGSFAAEDVGKRIEGNGGVAFLTATDGSYAIDTPFNDTSTISNWSMFALNVKSDALGIQLSNVLFSSFDIQNASYNQASFSAESQESSPRKFVFNNDGTKLYLIGNGYVLYEYNLTIPFDITTVNYNNSSFSVTEIVSGTPSVEFNNTGDKMYITDNENIYQYSLSTSFDISTASYDNVSFSFSAQVTSCRVGIFNNDGSSLYILESDGTLYQYTLSTLYDVSTASYSNKSFFLGNEDNLVAGIAFNSDGSKMFMVGYASDAVHQYTLSTPFDVSSGSYDNVFFSVSSEDTAPYAINFNNSGTKMFILGFTDNRIYEYSVGAFATPTSANHTAITSTSTNTEFWVDINSMTADDASNDGSVYYAVSTDDRTTWKIIDDSEGAERAIVRNNAGTWEINDASDYASETWVAASENDEFYALEEAVDLSTAQVTTGYDLDSGSYDNLSFSVSSEDAQVRAHEFSNDGKKLFTLGNVNNNVYQYSLPAAFDISSVSYDSVSFDVSSETTSPRALKFNLDGSKMYVCDANNDIYHYNLSSPFDLSSSSYSGKSVNLSNVPGNPPTMQSIGGIDFKNDGTKLFVVTSIDDAVFEFNLLTSYDIETAEYSGKSFSIAAQDEAPFGLYFSNNGDSFFVKGIVTDAVYKYDLNSSWDISSSSYSGQSIDISGQDTNARGGVSFSNDGKKMFIIGDESGSIHQYSTVAFTSLNRMNAIQLNEVSDANHYTLGDDLDLAVTLTMPDSGSTSPTSDGVSINYDAQVKNVGAILGADYEWDRPAADTVNFKALSNENFKIRVV